MPNVSNVRVYGLDEAIRAAKYPKAVELDGLTAEPVSYTHLTLPTTLPV